jgi:hypothetical protein
VAFIPKMSYVKPNIYAFRYLKLDIQRKVKKRYIFVNRPLSRPRRQLIFGQFSISHLQQILMAESAADLKKSGSSTKLKMLEKRLSFSPSGREALSKFIKFLSAASRRGYLRLTISRTQLSAGLN